LSADKVSRPKTVVWVVRERSREWLNAVNLHWAGVGLLAAVNVYLLVQMGFAWKLANSQNADALAQQRIQLRMAQVASKPLEGLDVKLASASEQADRFYMERLPVSYSEIASELGVLKNRTGVRLARLSYAQPTGAGAAGADRTPAPIGPDQFGGKLTEVQMDLNVTGGYRPLVTFINELERDKVFFTINGLTLTGQQTGMVSLRLRMTTYLRGLVAADEPPKSDAGATGSLAGDVDKAAETQTARRNGGTP